MQDPVRHWQEPTISSLATSVVRLLEVTVAGLVVVPVVNPVLSFTRKLTLVNSDTPVTLVAQVTVSAPVEGATPAETIIRLVFTALCCVFSKKSTCRGVPRVSVQLLEVTPFDHPELTTTKFPEVTFEVKASVPTPEPCVFPCTKVIAFNALDTFSVVASVAVWLFVSATWKVMLFCGPTVGVPVIAPVLVLSDSPDCKAPEVIDHVYAPFPPVAVSV